MYVCAAGLRACVPTVQLNRRASDCKYAHGQDPYCTICLINTYCYCESSYVSFAPSCTGAPLTKSCFHKHALTLPSPCRFHLLLSIGSVTYLLHMLIEYCMFRLCLPFNDGIGRSDQNTWHGPRQAKDAQRVGILSFVSFPPLIC